jgi:hypothetical protein
MWNQAKSRAVWSFNASKQEGDYRITFLAHSFEAFIRDLVAEEDFDKAF